MKKNYYKVHICPQCGREFFGRGTYCKKHYEQLRKYGKFLDNNPRTPKDLNEIITENGVTYLITYDKNNNPYLRFIIDEDDIPKIKNLKWGVAHNKKKPELIYLANNKVGLYHRYIMQPKEDETVDHINRNTLDNRKCNLRIASQTDQNHNQKVRSNIKFDIKGIDQHKDTNRKKRYMARFSMNKKTYRSPWYETYEEAIYARSLLEKLANVTVVNANVEQYINKLSDSQKELILTWFTNRFKGRV